MFFFCEFRAYLRLCLVKNLTLNFLINIYFIKKMKKWVKNDQKMLSAELKILLVEQQKCCQPSCQNTVSRVTKNDFSWAAKNIKIILVELQKCCHSSCQNTLSRAAINAVSWVTKMNCHQKCWTTEMLSVELQICCQLNYKDDDSWATKMLSVEQLKALSFELKNSVNRFAKIL